MAIGFEAEKIGCVNLRERLEAMPDSELIEFGKYARDFRPADEPIPRATR
jgi:hypothetical protein